MNRKFDEELCLTNETGRLLYHKYAEHMPIIDYHCHLQPKEICENKQFEDIGEMWLSGDHYKWRAMRTFGIDEKYITGNETSYYEKYMEFAKILPQLIGNPIYIWCALELKRFFGIDEPLGPDNAQEIYDRTKKLIAEKNITPRRCMEISHVELVSTTEDPIDDLRYHIAMQKDGTLKTRVITAFRPDKAMFAAKPGFGAYMEALGKAAGMPIGSFKEMLAALEQRLQYFKEITGTTVSDDGIPDFTWADASAEEIEAIFQKACRGEAISKEEDDKYRSAFLYEMGKMYNRNGYVMQLHIGTYQGANKSREASIGVACGFDCTDDSTRIKSVGELLDRLTKAGTLPKTILYPLNANNIETFAILAAGFCEGGTRAKVQLGAPWWFNDQAYGIRRQFEAVANLYPISLSVGMLTDSRSFLSYARHEYFRRILCALIGRWVENGEYPADMKTLGALVQDICCNNAKRYFDL